VNIRIKTKNAMNIRTKIAKALGSAVVIQLLSQRLYAKFKLWLNTFSTKQI